MSRIFLCGMTSKEIDNIKALTDPIYEHISGLIFVVDDGAFEDGTAELLEARKGEGVILHRTFRRHHDYGMNHWLLDSGVLKEGDWCVCRDSRERFNPEWASKMSNFISTLDFGGVRTIYNYNKIFAFKWADHLYFVSSPHFGLEGAQPKAIEMSNYHDETRKEWTWRILDGEDEGRPIDNKIDHEAKYIWNYGRSNHLLLGRENDIEEYQRLEIIRKHVRDQARLLGFSMDLKGLEDFMRWITSEEVEDQTRENGRNWINSNHITRNFYRKHILNHVWDDIISTENSWELKL